MFSVLGSPRRCCDGLTRRETLRIGALTALGGFGLPEYLRAREMAGASPPGRAKGVIVLYLLGGAPTQDMYDLKPNAPSEIRGEFSPIATSASGIDVCELLPEHARWMHKAAIVRSVNHDGGCHNTLPSYTGYEAKLANIVETKDTYPPSMGSVCEYLNPPTSNVPAYVYMPCYLGWGQSIRRPGPYAGFLGKRYDPLFTECEPYVDKPPDVPYHSQVLRGVPKIPDSALREGMTIDRLNTRRSLLDQIDAERFRFDSASSLVTFDKQSERAWSILTSSAVRKAFDLSTEDPKLLDRYGRCLFGHCSLIGRKLIEAGVRFVNVTWDCYYERLKLQFECWDTHSRNAGVLRDHNLPTLDRTFGALMQDLDERGLLDETLVVVMSDFGRTPRINSNAGRDHWTYCYSVLFAGAGIRGGSVYGKSDAQAAFVKEAPVSTGDICATIYHCLGIDPEMRVPDQLGRPMEIAHGGHPIRDILV
ncbi:MAG: DUF1501 domain-containing protein [Planctomycetaceae bacterium]